MIDNQDSSRRRFLQLGLAGTVAGLMTEASMDLAQPNPVSAESIITPDAALQELVDGNGRFMAGHLTVHDLAALRKKTVNKQEPFAALLSCSDSRVPVELVFDRSIGDLFVARNAGNVVTSEIVASLEYGAAVLGTKVILVLGHQNCGAVKATIEAKEVPGQISALYPHIQPAVDQAGPDMPASVKANAKIQASLLRKASTVIAGLVKENKLKVVAGYYNLATGKVTLLD